MYELNQKENLTGITIICQYTIELNQKENLTGTTITCQYTIYTVHIGFIQHILLHFQK